MTIIAKKYKKNHEKQELAELTNATPAYRMSGTSKIPKDKAATFGYKVFETDSLEEMATYINTHAVVPCQLKDGHRKKENVEAVFSWLRLDVDKEGEAEKIDKALKKVSHIKKPSTNNAKYPYKFHYFVPIDNVSQNYDEYKMQYYHFLSEHGIELSDKSLASVVQNTNFFKGTLEEATEKTVIKAKKKHKIWVAPKVKAPEKKVHEEKHSDMSKDDVKRLLTKVSPDCTYSEWLNVGLSLYDWCPKRGLKLFDKWSKQSDKYDGSTFDKWSDFQENASGDITLGTLVHMAHGDKINPVSLFKPEKGSTFPLTTAQKQSIKEANEKKEENRNNYDPFTAFGEGLTIKKLNERGNQKQLFGNLVVEKSHCMWIAPSGQMKTTGASVIMGEILKNHTDKKLMFFSLDTIETHNKAIIRHFEDIGVLDRVKIIDDITSSEFWEWVKTSIEYKTDMKDIIILIDGYQDINNDINSKRDNKNTLNQLKTLKNVTGATIVTLAHTNKDGSNSSGTAELEQLSDGIVRVGKTVDDFSKKVSLTFSPFEGKRVRHHFEPISMTAEHTKTMNTEEYLYTALTTFKMDDADTALAKVEKTKSEDEEKRLEKKNDDLITKYKNDIHKIKDVITDILSNKIGVLTRQNVLENALSYTTNLGKPNPNYIAGRNTVISLLKALDGRELECIARKDANNKPNFFYYVKGNKQQKKELKKRIESIHKMKEARQKQAA